MWIVRVIDSRKYFKINLNIQRIVVSVILLLIQGIVIILLDGDHYIVHTTIFAILLVIYKDTLLSILNFSKKLLIACSTSKV